MLNLTSRNTTKLFASNQAVINEFLHLPGAGRVRNIVERVKNMTEKEVNESLHRTIEDFGSRHREIEKVFKDHFQRASEVCHDDVSEFSTSRQLLLGAFFTKEYSIQSAALFNPSIVPHPDQTGLRAGEQRFIMSLRATGEGHISSIIFKTGTIDEMSKITLDKDSTYSTKLKRNTEHTYSRSFIEKRIAFYPGLQREIVELLPANFTAAEILSVIRHHDAQGSSLIAPGQLQDIFDTNYDLNGLDLPINEQVIFPSSKAERTGMEDARFVRFTDGATICYYGTYTAYDGNTIRTQLIETNDFRSFKVRALYGSAISDKGMALFPEKVNGKYVMVARQGGEKITIMHSEDLYVWENFEVLLEPQYPWELVQLGNCGSPVKTDKGWLLLTHGVGVMRTYVISAILLDLSDPSRIIGRLTYPLIHPEESEREGYVPNVVYTCGLLKHGDVLLIPYAMSDSATGFITVRLKQLLDQMKA
jgi:predicted GH43/DUF377 family glycosyl hydrolase